MPKNNLTEIVTIKQNVPLRLPNCTTWQSHDWSMVKPLLKHPYPLTNIASGREYISIAHSYTELISGH